MVARNTDPAPTAGLVCRAGRGRTDRADRARLPGRAAVGRLGSMLIGLVLRPPSGRVRLPQTAY